MLRRFADHGDEVAFRELVNRYVALVYGAALRQTCGVSHLAEEVAQSVFTLLARQAKNLTAHPTLEGWLFTTTRNCARDAVRAVSRRRRYEQETAAMREPTANRSPGEVNWTALAPTIDEALNRLSLPDREGILLRFFEKCSYAELGVRLGLAENTARMRVERALERLRRELKRRGITSTAALLAVALSNQTAVAVPAYLSGQIAAVALAKTVAVAASGAGLTGIFEFMKATKIICAIGLLAVAWRSTKITLRVLPYNARRNLNASKGRSKNRSTTCNRSLPRRKTGRRRRTTTTHVCSRWSAKCNTTPPCGRQVRVGWK